ncbi:MAG TPA: hypothetical protein H9858_11325 [Candidatus Blautia stercoravium]|nr:hypothetical protein [Candidatus Blautia stercoravium]
MWIPSLQAVIETKCTRKSMTIKKLTYFNRNFDGKEVKIFLLQPVKM